MGKAGQDVSDVVGVGNADVAWYRFDPQVYLAHNYAVVLPEDRRVLELVRDFFGDTGLSAGGQRGIDVGTGANLYPALSMLPFCESITLYEYAKSNLEWLAEQAAADWPSWSEVWGEFWTVLRERDPYAGFDEHPREALASRAEVAAGSVFALDEAAERWDMGTMFFVAESITTRCAEFVAAVHGFLGVLRPGAPFAIAFMADSTGYQVGGVSFPAVAIRRDDVSACLADRATDVAVSEIPTGGANLRHGYTGMILACGRALGNGAGPDSADGELVVAREATRPPEPR